MTTQAQQASADLAAWLFARLNRCLPTDQWQFDQLLDLAKKLQKKH